MSRFRLILLSLFAVFAVNAVASVSASASEYLTASGKVTGKWLTLSAQLTNAVLKSTGANIEITCKKTLNTGLIEAGGASSASILFEECSVQKPAATCKVTEPVHFEAHGQLVTEEGKTLDSFTPAKGTLFATVHFTSCSLEEVQIEGMFRSSVETLTMQLRNILKFTNNSPSGLLTFGGSNMTFTLEDCLWLENDENWGVID